MSEQQALSITQQLKHALATINRISDDLVNADVTDNNVIKELLHKDKKYLGKVLALRTTQIVLSDREAMKRSNNTEINQSHIKHQDNSGIISILPYLRRLCV
ncbi:hypothetical protein [Cysteiniphilum halobium]|uniref:hypothetical protein n=1 Tax=Cysteiniphilum halobium TaxID=2219059 RepID=UPI000E64FE78|nr:hypothetical protein [Cysteiniphilum halobium]